MTELICDLFYEPIHRTNNMVNRLMIISINSGLVTMISALLAIVFVWYHWLNVLIFFLTSQ